MSRFFAVAALVLLSLPPAAAQAPRPLRYVRHLRPVAPPPGGLVPYRRGSLWGYADTSGRVVYAPSLPEMPPCVADPLVARYPPRLDEPPTDTRVALHHRSVNQFDYGRQATWFVNGAGDILRLDYLTQAAVLLPDGSLRVQARRRSGGRREVIYQGRAADGHYQQLTQPVARGWPRVWLHPLGAGRWAGEEINRIRTQLTLVSKNELFKKEYYRPLGYWALLDEAGRPLTPYQYQAIGPFRQGRAVFLRGGRYGYLDRAGREVVPPEFEVAQEFSHGWARVGSAQRQGMVDTLGHFFPATSLADDARLLRQPVLGGGVHYVHPGGREAFAGRFTAAGSFSNGRAWVRCGAQLGLLNEQGRWVAPCQYDELGYGWLGRPRQLVRDWNLARQNALGLPVEEHSPSGRGDGIDTAYLQFRRGGRVGYLRRHTGQEVIAARYDSVRVPLWHNVATLWRGGTSYVVTGQGRELGPGELGRVLPAGGRRYFELRQGSGWLLTDSAGTRQLASDATRPVLLGVLPGGLVAVATTPNCGYPANVLTPITSTQCAGAVEWAGRWVVPPRYAGMQPAGPLILAEGVQWRRATPCTDYSRLQSATVLDSTGHPLTARPYWDARYLPDSRLLVAHTWGLCLPADTLVLLDEHGRVRLRQPGPLIATEAETGTPLPLRQQLVLLARYDGHYYRASQGALGYYSRRGRRFWED